tara:strand:- start:310 stop:444 length:135 start_codon:yes stop_codon:yes gene_type:complete
MAKTKKSTTSKKTTQKKMKGCGPNKGGIAIVLTMAKKPNKKKRT